MFESQFYEFQLLTFNYCHTLNRVSLYSPPILSTRFCEIISINQDQILSLLKYSSRLSSHLCSHVPDASLLLQPPSFTLWHPNKRCLNMSYMNYASDYHYCCKDKDKAPIKDTNPVSLSEQ